MAGDRCLRLGSTVLQWIFGIVMFWVTCKLLDNLINKTVFSKGNVAIYLLIGNECRYKLSEFQKKKGMFGKEYMLILLRQSSECSLNCKCWGY